MAIKPIKRGYSFSDGTLAELADELVAYAVRDNAQMIGFGYDAAKLALINAKITAFKEFANDDYFTGLMMEATATKNEAIKSMSIAGQEIVQRGVIKFGKNSPQERALAFTGYAGKTDSEKISACRTTHKFATEKLDDLAGQGLTTAILDAFKDKITAADTALTDKRMAVSERDTAVHDRIKLGNDLYRDLVPLADTGKTIWENTDESKYNDYVIYDSQPNMHTVSGNAPATAVHAPSVTVSEAGDEIEITVTSGTLTAYFSDDPTDEPAPGQATATISADVPYSGNAADLGWSSENFRLLLKNDGAADVPFIVVVRG